MKPATRRQCFVEFLSPGTFFDETTEKPIESWDVKTAAKMARNITERHGAKPYGFVFRTKLIAEDIDDGEGGKMEVKAKEVEASGTHYLDGDVKRYEDIDASENTLRSNMRINGYPLVCETRNGYRHTGIFADKDRVVSAKTGAVLASGSDAALKKYRAEKLAEWKR